MIITGVMHSCQEGVYLGLTHSLPGQIRCSTIYKYDAISHPATCRAIQIIAEAYACDCRDWKRTFMCAFTNSKQNFIYNKMLYSCEKSQILHRYNLTVGSTEYRHQKYKKRSIPC